MTITVALGLSICSLLQSRLIDKSGDLVFCLNIKSKKNKSTNLTRFQFFSDSFGLWSVWHLASTIGAMRQLDRKPASSYVHSSRTLVSPTLIRTLRCSVSTIAFQSRISFDQFVCRMPKVSLFCSGSCVWLVLNVLIGRQSRICTPANLQSYSEQSQSLLGLWIELNWIESKECVQVVKRNSYMAWIILNPQQRRRSWWTGLVRWSSSRVVRMTNAKELSGRIVIYGKMSVYALNAKDNHPPCHVVSCLLSWRVSPTTSTPLFTEVQKGVKMYYLY